MRTIRATARLWADGPRAATGRSRALALCLAALCTTCASAPESPRTAYAKPRLPEAAADPEPTFRILDDWQWTQTLDARAVGPALAALDHEPLGLHPPRRFELATGACGDCNAPEPALWWFRDTLIAVPEREPSERIAGPRAERPTTESGDDPPPPGSAERRPVPSADELQPPPVVWLGAPQVITGARLSSDARTLEIGESRLPLALTPRAPTNIAYVDSTTAAFFAGRTLRVRGAMRTEPGEPTFVARALWPEDAPFDVASITYAPLRERETLGTLVEAQASAAAAPLDARVVFERQPRAPRAWTGRPVLALVLSGAQSSSDASRGGHLAVATGVVGADGEWSNWLVNDFYPLIEPTAKDILPGPVPIDNYLLALNSGQLYYRPVYMLVAVLREPRTAVAVQDALQRMMLRYYCRDFEFDQQHFNSTTMTIDPIRALGWRIPHVGPTSRIAAIVAAPIAALAGRGLGRGRDAYQALTTEKTRLLPRVAFEVAGHDLLALVAREPPPTEAALTPFERSLAEDLEALVFVRLPQVPSARPLGTYPVRSLLEYGAWLLASPTSFATEPLPPAREFPERLAQICRATATGRTDLLAMP